jgi:hypothetical protein
MLKRGILLLGLVLLMSQHSFAVPRYVVTLQNDQPATSSTYEFDVYIQSLSGSLNLTSYQLILTYNTAIGGAGTLTFTYIMGSCEISTLPSAYDYIILDGDALKLAAVSQTVPSTITNSPVRLGRFRITNTATFAGEQPNVDWNFTGNSGGTKVYIDGVNATADGEFDNLLGNSPLPIQLAALTASVVRNNTVELAWKTVSETNNYGFEIYRKRNETGEWEKLGFVEGHGTTLAAHSYTYVDRSVAFGEYSYRIKQIDLDGKSEAFQEQHVTVGAEPEKLTLAQNYPNPFNPTTVIEFGVPQNGPATLKVYSSLGQEVTTLFDGNAETGKIYGSRFDASNLASGLYFYTVRSAGNVETKRMVLMK